MDRFVALSLPKGLNPPLTPLIASENKLAEHILDSSTLLRMTDSKVTRPPRLKGLPPPLPSFRKAGIQRTTHTPANPHTARAPGWGTATALSPSFWPSSVIPAKAGIQRTATSFNPSSQLPYCHSGDGRNPDNDPHACQLSYSKASWIPNSLAVRHRRY